MSTTKPTLDDIVTVFSALRIPISESAGRCAAQSAVLMRFAARLRKEGFPDLALTAEQCGEESNAIGMQLATVLESTDRLFNEPRPPRQRTGEWAPPPTPEETAANLAETVRNPIGDVAEANARDKK